MRTWCPVALTTQQETSAWAGAAVGTHPLVQIRRSVMKQQGMRPTILQRQPEFLPL